MKTALFLGAGASAFIKKPTTKDLLIELSMRYKSDPFVSSILADPIPFQDIEYLYTALNDLLNLKYSPGLSLLNRMYHDNSNMTFEKFLSKLQELRNDIRIIILNRYNINDNQIEFVASIYDTLILFLTNYGSKEFQVITTNYDTVVDNYAYTHYSNNVIDGFSETKNPLKRIWDQNFKSLNDASFYLIKLHGSITWYRDDDKIFQIGDVTLHDEKNDVLIAPTLSPKHYDSEPFKSLIEQFKKILDEIDILIVIGFSFRDTELKEMIKDAVDSNGLKIISISPTAGYDLNKHFEIMPIALDSSTSSYEIFSDSYFYLDIEFKYATLKEILLTLDLFFNVLS